MAVNEMNVLTLAYIGDAIYELKIRNYLVTKNIFKVSELQKKAINYVSANSQANFFDYLVLNNLLLSDELDIINRARNHKVNSKPKHASIVTYKKATALEALFGYLYLKDDIKRIDYIISLITGVE